MMKALQDYEAISASLFWPGLEPGAAAC